MCPASPVGLAGVSPVWIKISHQSSTNSRRWNGNRLPEAGRREVAGSSEGKGYLTAPKYSMFRMPKLFIKEQAALW